MTTREIETLISRDGKCSYNETNKAQFKKLSMKLLRALKAELEVDADLRYNAAGIACSGDATYHSDSVYVSFNADGMGLGILYRSCKGRKDYTGDRNRWFSFNQLRQHGVAGLASVCARMFIENHVVVVPIGFGK
jgi:hypothetical protein